MVPAAGVSDSLNTNWKQWFDMMRYFTTTSVASYSMFGLPFVALLAMQLVSMTTRFKYVVVSLFSLFSSL